MLYEKLKILIFLVGFALQTPFLCAGKHKIDYESLCSREPAEGFCCLSHARCFNFINAIKTFDLKSAKRLLLVGVSVDIKDESGMTALMLAARMLDIDVIKFLLKNGADPFIVNCDNEIALEFIFKSDKNIRNSAEKRLECIKAFKDFDNHPDDVPTILFEQ
ncbi:MAG: hypothetical protein UR26_C0002G0209 [candidate division TM6 bacterium GW2011_GWF2_32_72]|nr:MAG: hypothetical protein UR26_C0002G0209 [candidate division TM6 bacterium GW2011_GWF2_32_72]